MIIIVLVTLVAIFFATPISNNSFISIFNNNMSSDGIEGANGNVIEEFPNSLGKISKDKNGTSIENKYVAPQYELTIPELKTSYGIASEATGNTLPLKLDVNSKESRGDNFLYLAILVLSIAIIVSTLVSFYLYRWRKILISQPNSVVPEEWSKYLSGVGAGLNDLSNKNEKYLQMLIKSNSDLGRRVSSMTDTYMELHSVLDEKDKEIKRLKSGYDSEIFRKYIARFARIEQALLDIMEDEPGNANLEMLDRLFEDAFAECGVEKHEPKLGSDYRSVNGVSDNPKMELTSDPSLEFKISEVIEVGYELIMGDYSKTIIPSKVRVYKFDKENQ